MLENNLSAHDNNAKCFWKDFNIDLGPIISRLAHGAKNEKDFKSPRFDKLLKLIFEKTQCHANLYLFTPKETLELPFIVYQQILFSLLRAIAENNLQMLTKSSGLGENIIGNFEENTFSYISSPQKIVPLILELTGFNFLPNLIPYLPAQSEVFINGSPIGEINPEDLKSHIQMREDGPIDWFELDPRFYFKGEELSLEDALKLTKGPLVEFKGKYYRIDTSLLPNIKWLEFLWNRLQGFQTKSKSGKTSTSIYKVPRSSSLEILALRAAGLKIEGGAQWQKICHEFDALLEYRHEDFIPSLPEVTTPLKDYQKIGVQWMLGLYQLHLGGILADDMGLGKTLQALRFLACCSKEANSVYL